MTLCLRPFFLKGPEMWHNHTIASSARRCEQVFLAKLQSYARAGESGCESQGLFEASKLRGQQSSRNRPILVAENRGNRPRAQSHVY